MKSTKKKINLSLEYDPLSFLFALTPVAALMISVSTQQLPSLIIDHYDSIPHIVFWIQAVIVFLIGSVILFFFLLHIIRSIHGFLCYTFLPQWFAFYRFIYSPKKYVEFLEDCIVWSETGLPRLSEYKKKKYSSPFAMFDFWQTKLMLRRYSHVKSMAKQQLKTHS
jgi:hypothetical protein